MAGETSHKDHETNHLTLGLTAHLWPMGLYISLLWQPLMVIGSKNWKERRPMPEMATSSERNMRRMALVW